MQNPIIITKNISDQSAVFPWERCKLYVLKEYNRNTKLNDIEHKTFYANQEMPDYEGYFIAYFKDESDTPLIIHLVRDEDGIMQGRGCYLEDYYLVEYVTHPEEWERF